MPEIEGKGLDYERYALNHLFKRFVRQHGIKTVLEIPARGEKAMPSLYSLAFGEAGCRVTLVNAHEKSKPAWRDLGFDVSYAEAPDLTATHLQPGAFDLVWNFMTLAQHERKAELVAEMKRLSSRYLLFIAVNKFNPGFLSHRAVHRYFQVPWTHGDVEFMSPFATRRWLKAQGLEIVETGVVDTPPYPDSLGFRDMKLHRLNVDLNEIDWESRTLGWMKSGKYPLKLKLLYAFEAIPMPLFLKIFYAHLFFVLARKPAAAGGAA